MLPLSAIPTRNSSTSKNVHRGAWSRQEDDLLIRCIEKHGSKKWSRIPELAGLNRCRKSCRLRWLNYLDPSINRGDFDEDEIDLIFRLHRLLGNRWSLIAGRLPDRTANDVKNYWNSHLRKKFVSVEGKKDEGKKEAAATSATVVIKPQARTVSSPNWSWLREQRVTTEEPRQGETSTEVRPSIEEDLIDKIREDATTDLNVGDIELLGEGELIMNGDLGWEDWFSM